VRVHFRHEEEVMRKLGYVDYRRHVQLHAQLIDRLNALSVDIASGHWHGEGLREFMSDWLLGHILEEDMRLAGCLGGRVTDEGPPTA
jgi:hemerythrin